MYRSTPAEAAPAEATPLEETPVEATATPQAPGRRARAPKPAAEPAASVTPVPAQVPATVPAAALPATVAPPAMRAANVTPRVRPSAGGSILDLLVTPFTLLLTGLLVPMSRTSGRGAAGRSSGSATS